MKDILHDFNPEYTPEDLLALFSITGGVAWYVTLLLDRGKTRKNKMLAALTEENSPFINEGKNILIEEFGTDYVIYFSILTCIASGMKTSAEIKNELGIENISSYLSRLEDYYGLISKYQPISPSLPKRAARRCAISWMTASWYFGSASFSSIRLWWKIRH